jgi:adenosylhomocysteine nucleosidase
MNTVILVALPEELDANLVDVPVVYTGVGLSNAAMMTYDAIVKYKPQKIINYGSAGALKDHSGLLTVAAVCQRDANCEPLRERGFMLGENILYYQSGQSGVRCGSGNNFVTDPDSWTRDHCDIVDMELWAIAKVCDRLHISWTSKKWISDKADSDAGNTWEAALAAGQTEFLKWFNSGKYTNT